MNVFRIITSSLLIVVATLLIGASSVRVQAEDVLKSVCPPGSSATLCEDHDASKNQNGNNLIYGPNGILTKAIHILSIVIGVAAVIMIIIGGFKYVIANGDSNSINSAKNTILYAIIGLVISVLAQGIIIFILNKL